MTADTCISVVESNFKEKPSTKECPPRRHGHEAADIKIPAFSQTRQSRTFEFFETKHVKCKIAQRLLRPSIGRCDFPST